VVVLHYQETLPWEWGRLSSDGEVEVTVTMAAAPVVVPDLQVGRLPEAPAGADLTLSDDVAKVDQHEGDPAINSPARLAYGPDNTLYVVDGSTVTAYTVRR